MNVIKLEDVIRDITLNGKPTSLQAWFALYLANDDVVWNLVLRRTTPNMEEGTLGKTRGAVWCGDAWTDKDTNFQAAENAIHTYANRLATKLVWNFVIPFLTFVVGLMFSC